MCMYVFFSNVLLETQELCGSVRSCTSDCRMSDACEQDGCHTRNSWRRFRRAMEDRYNKSSNNEKA